MSRKSRGNTCVEETWFENTTGPKVKAENMESQSWCERPYEGNTKLGRRERCHGNRGESNGQWLSTSDAENKLRNELRGYAYGKMEAFLEEAWFQGGEEYKRSKGRYQKQGLQTHIHHLHWKQRPVFSLFSYDAQEHTVRISSLQ